MSEHTYELLVREQHVDSLGHMNNATYLQIFEEARWQMITERGYGFNEIQKQQMGPVILAVTLTFKKEVRLRENIKIISTCIEYPTKVGKFQQLMVSADNEVRCEAIFTFGLVDMKLRKLIRPSDSWLKACGLESQTAPQ